MKFLLTCLLFPHEVGQGKQKLILIKKGKVVLNIIAKNQIKLFILYNSYSFLWFEYSYFSCWLRASFGSEECASWGVIFIKCYKIIEDSSDRYL